MAAVQDGEARHLKDDSKFIERDATGFLVPTKETASLRRFEFIIHRPMVTDRLCSLEQADLKLGPRARPRKAGTPWRRGQGCVKLVLPEKTQRLATRLSFVAGNMVIIYKEPTKFRAMPMITLRFFAATMNAQGHVNWPTNFKPASKQLLRKMVRIKLQKLLGDPEYPVSQEMRRALTASQDSVLRLQASARDPPQPDN